MESIVRKLEDRKEKMKGIKQIKEEIKRIWEEVRIRRQVKINERNKGKTQIVKKKRSNREASDVGKLDLKL